MTIENFEKGWTEVSDKMGIVREAFNKVCHLSSLTLLGVYKRNLTQRQFVRHAMHSNVCCRSLRWRFRASYSSALL